MHGADASVYSLIWVFIQPANQLEEALSRLGGQSSSSIKTRDSPSLILPIARYILQALRDYGNLGKITLLEG